MGVALGEAPNADHLRHELMTRKLQNSEGELTPKLQNSEGELRDLQDDTRQGKPPPREWKRAHRDDPASQPTEDVPDQSQGLNDRKREQHGRKDRLEPNPDRRTTRDQTGYEQQDGGLPPQDKPPRNELGEEEVQSQSKQGARQPEEHETPKPEHKPTEPEDELQEGSGTAQPPYRPQP